jgi:microcin C transport system substrate-binding protein
LNARFFQRACGAALLIAIPMMTAAKASASEREWRHGLSLFGDLKYKPDFKHFDYVNPDAPKGGSVRQLAIGTFDNFNLVVAGVKGAMAVGVDLVFDTLTAPALDAGRKHQLSLGVTQDIRKVSSQVSSQIDRLGLTP